MRRQAGQQQGRRSLARASAGRGGGAGPATCHRRQAPPVQAPPPPPPPLPLPPPPLPPPPLPTRAAAAVAAAILSWGACCMAGWAATAPPPAWSGAAYSASASASASAPVAAPAKPPPPSAPWSPADPPPPVGSLPPLRAFSPPKVERATLPSNGLRIVFVPDRDTPTVRGVLIMRGGARAAPAAHPAAAALAAAVQRSGGSRAHPGPDLDAALDAVAASIEAGAAADGTSIGFEGLAPDLRTLVGLVGELVTDPALPPPRLALAQAGAVDALRHRDDAPGALPGREAAKLIYGRASVHARSPTIEDVMGTTVGDLRAYLAAWQRPDAAVLAVVGDTSLSGVVDAVKASPLGTVWAAPPGPPPPLPNTPLADAATYAGKTFLIDRPGLAQATVVLAEPGVALTDPDAPALDVLGGALSSFGGRLFDGLRSRDGLAYSVSASWDTGRPDHRGLFLAGGSTAEPGRFLAGLVAALDGLGPAGGAQLADADVQRARAVALNGFVFNFATPDALASRAASLALAGVDPDYLATYRAGLGAVTPGRVAAAAAAHLHPRDGAVAVVVGDARSVRPALEAAGRGPVLDLVPEPVAKVKSAAAAAAAVAAPPGEEGGAASSKR